MRGDPGGAHMEWLLPALVSAVALLAAVWYLFLRGPAKRATTPPVAAAVKTGDNKPAAAAGAKAPATPKTVRKTITRSLGEACDMRVLWASQTGTAESFAQTMVDEAAKHGITAVSMDIDLYDPLQMAKDTAVLCFVVATYGEGEPTDNSKFFVESMNGAEAARCEAVRFTVFGLGNKTYQQFNAMGRLFDRRLAELGARRVAERGEGDDDANLEEDFKAWRRRTWPVLVAALKGTAPPAPGAAPDTDEADEPATWQPHYRLEACADGGAAEERFEWREAQSGPFDAKRPFVSRVLVTRELHTGGDRSCRHIELELAAGQSYEPGDHLAVYAPNPSLLVQRLLDRLGVADAAQVVRLVGLRDPANVHLGPVSIRSALRYFLDITSPPRKQMLVALAAHCADKASAAALLAMASKEGHETYMREVKAPSTTLEELLSEHPSCRPPLDLVLQLLPRLAPRYYSISSAPGASPGRVSITVAVLRYVNSKGRQHDGVCTTWLAALPVGAPVPMFVRTSSFRLPPAASTPVLMVGPGTGLAPFRGFVQARALAGAPAAATVLYFGCRHREHDYLYREELEAHAAAGHLTLVTAFSREHTAKCYVQHRIDEHAAAVAALLQAGAWVYVCGDARRMPAEVREALAGALVKHGAMSAAEADATLERMHKEGRYQLDVWY